MGKGRAENSGRNIAESEVELPPRQDPFIEVDEVKDVLRCPVR